MNCFSNCFRKKPNPIKSKMSLTEPYEKPDLSSNVCTIFFITSHLRPVEKPREDRN